MRCILDTWSIFRFYGQQNPKSMLGRKGLRTHRCSWVCHEWRAAMNVLRHVQWCHQELDSSQSSIEILEVDPKASTKIWKSLALYIGAFWWFNEGIQANQTVYLNEQKWIRFIGWPTASSDHPEHSLKKEMRCDFMNKSFIFLIGNIRICMTQTNCLVVKFVCTQK